MAREAGQATVELVAALPALLLAGLLALQLLATGYALTLADGAAARARRSPRRHLFRGGEAEMSFRCALAVPQTHKAHRKVLL